MASVRVPGMHSWGKQYYSWLPGVHGLSPCHGGGLGALFLLGLWVVER
jgi:hypothetical protein